MTHNKLKLEKSSRSAFFFYSVYLSNCIFVFLMSEIRTSISFQHSPCLFLFLPLYKRAFFYVYTLCHCTGFAFSLSYFLSPSQLMHSITILHPGFYTHPSPLYLYTVLLFPLLALFKSLSLLDAALNGKSIHAVCLCGPKNSIQQLSIYNGLFMS